MRPLCVGALAGAVALLSLPGCEANPATGRMVMTATAGAVLNTVVQDGQLFCAASQGPAGAAVVAVIDATAPGRAVTVTNKASAWVAAACPLVNGIPSFPVSPPPDPTTVPAVAVVPPPPAKV